MTIPIVFHAKAMATRILSFAFGVVVVAILLLYFDHSINENQESMVIPIPGGAVGPESFSFDGHGGGPYTGVSDGRIIRWLANESRWVDFAVTSPERNGCEGPHDHSQTEHICGRPLGLRFNEKTGQLYIADAYMGLLVVGPNGGLASPIAKEVDGIAFGFTNSLDIDQDSGDVYFTDSSTRFPRRNHVSVIISGDNTGRLVKFEAKSKKTTLLLDNLRFPNGVALSKSGDFLLFVETTTCKLYKLWLKTPKVGNVEVIAQFPGFPDNIKRNKNGEFWVGINSRRGKLLEWVISNPWIGNALVRLFPIDITKAHLCLARLIGRYGMGIRLDENGNVVEILDSSKGKRWKFVSEVDEENEDFWIGSVTNSFVVREKTSITPNQ
ncbi:putative alkaloid synthase/Surface mucin Hemomucin [Handroanthus impetiginosus]|uniref:Putative alkaloid synthase/Surface mucin Hemomucin n=1 Tax=Handroanthus impetiginosus TaxID=429701 RepID=A0A2G9HLA9_9LAMI|nr:putative alkaloid synthase/Surface mucin Hemomucin [Handroanthus impetiginosus]